MTKEEQKAVEEFTEMNLTKKGLYHYNDMQDAFLIGLFKGEKMQPSLPSNLDEAAEEYGRNTFINECMENGVCDNHDLSDAFKAGAEWQKEQMMKDGNVILAEEVFDAEKEKSMKWGYNLCKEQMMEEAAEGDVVKIFPEGVASIHYLAPAGIGEMAYFCSDNGLNIGDKVRIIIVKEDER